MSTHDVAAWRCPACGDRIEAERVVDDTFTPRVDAHRQAHARLQAALNAGHTVTIPDDGQEHACVCGHGGYSVWDGDGWLRRGRHVVTDDEGRTVSRCHSCDRELEAGA